jgi:hypothetical protein
MSIDHYCFDARGVALACGLQSAGKHIIYESPCLHCIHVLDLPRWWYGSTQTSSAEVLLPAISRRVPAAGECNSVDHEHGMRALAGLRTKQSMVKSRKAVT